MTRRGGTQRVRPPAGRRVAADPAPAAPVEEVSRPLDGEALLRLLSAGMRWLERNAAAVNALNVFPVPDGDTGTNMLLTIRAAVEAAAKLSGDDAASAALVLR